MNINLKVKQKVQMMNKLLTIMELKTHVLKCISIYL